MTVRLAAQNCAATAGFHIVAGACITTLAHELRTREPVALVATRPGRVETATSKTDLPIVAVPSGVCQNARRGYGRF